MRLKKNIFLSVSPIAKSDRGHRHNEWSHDALPRMHRFRLSFGGSISEQNICIHKLLSFLIACIQFCICSLHHNCAKQKIINYERTNGPDI